MQENKTKSTLFRFSTGVLEQWRVEKLGSWTAGRDFSLQPDKISGTSWLPECVVC
jgi:hypothetical protein